MKARFASSSRPAMSARSLAMTCAKSDLGKLDGCCSMKPYVYPSASVRRNFLEKSVSTAPA